MVKREIKTVNEQRQRIQHVSSFAHISVVGRYSLLVNSRVAGRLIVAHYFIDGSLTLLSPTLG